MPLNVENSYQWKITNPSLIKQIRNSKNGKQFVSDVFELCSLNWRIEINPNGCNKERNGSFDIFVKLMSISSKWKNITVCRCIESTETKSNFTAIDTYATKGESSGWPAYSLTLNEIKKVDLKQLTIIVRIKVIQITLKKNDSVYYHTDFKYNKVQKISCKLDTNTLNILKKSSIGKRWTSKIYNNMWAIQIYPNGNNKSGNSKCIVALVLCALPANRSKIRTQWNLMVNELNFRQNKFNEFTLTKFGSTIRIGTFADFQKCIAFTININILIVKEYDYIGKDINQSVMRNTHKNHKNHIRAQTTCNEQKMSGDIFMNHKQYIDDKLAVYDTKINVLTTKIDELMECNKLKDDKIKILKYKLDEKMSEINDKLTTIIDDEKGSNYSYENVMNEINKMRKELNKLRKNAVNISPITQFFEVELNLSEYIGIFIENGFDDMESLNDINMDELKELGIKMGHRKKILKYIQQRNIQKNINIAPRLSFSEGGNTILV